MKRILLLALCLLLTAMTMLPVMAQTEEEAMLLLVKERIKSTEQYKEFNSSVQKSEQGTYYMFDWNNGDQNLSVTINGEGIITSYYEYDWSQPIRQTSFRIERPAMEELKVKAEQLLKKLNPDLEFSMETSSDLLDLHSDSVLFRVQRTHQGIPVIGDNGNISIDMMGETLNHFSMNYTQGISFESTQPKVEVAKAKEAYAKELAPALYYIQEEEANVPMYRLQDGYKFISANTGEVLKQKEDIIIYAGGGEKSVTDARAPQALTPEEIEHLDEVEGLLSKEQIEKTIRDNKLLSFDPSLPLKDFYRGRMDQDTYYASLSFSNEDWSKSTSAGVNAKTGELTWYSDNSFDIKEPDQERKHDEAKETKAFQSLAGNKAKEFRYDKETNRFVRYAADIPFESDSAYVTLNEAGKVVSYSIYYNQKELKSAAGAITPEQATAKLFEQAEYSLYYLAQEGAGKLVYGFGEDKPQRIDPFTGEIGFDWDQTTPEKAVYTDLEGHYAKDSIEALASFGIGFESGAFHPDQTITVGEFSSLLYNVFNGWVGEPEQVERWMKMLGVLSEEVEVQAPLTRQTAAKALVFAMGYGEVAQVEGIYVTPFTDVTQDIGPIAILSGMGILSGNGDGSFSPSQSMTRAEAMVMLYRYLSRK